MRCDCGNYTEFPLKSLNRMQHLNIRINCKDSIRHPENGLWYPPTPAPYHPEAGILLEKYLHLTKSSYKKNKSAVEDEKLDRLIRACWIVTYRRLFLGEDISELKEKRLIKKHLRYASIHVFWKSKVEHFGGLMYDASNKKREIGINMTNLTYENYPVIETQGIKTVSTKPEPVKRIKFKRC